MMNKKRKVAEALDSYFDDLLRDTNATAPITKELDTQTVQLLRQVVLVERGRAEDAIDATATKARVWQKVVTNAQAASRLRSRASDSRFRFSQFFHRHWQRVAIAAVCFFIAIGVSLYALASRTSRVSAQEIIEKAYAAATLPSTGRVQSFVLTETQRSVPANQRLNALGGLNGDEQIVNETKRWYEAPNRWRVEFQQTILAADGSEISHSNSVEVSDGIGIWSYDPVQNTVVVNPYDPAVIGKDGVSLFGQNTGVLNDLLQQAATCFDPKVTGSASVAGRETYVIDLGPTKCPSASAPEMNGRLVLWVDQETFFVLKQEQYSTDGTQVIMTSEVSQVQYNAALDPSLFTFVPPAGAGISDNRPKSAPVAGEYQKQLEQLAGQVDFPIFMPGYLPQGLEPRQPRLNVVQENSVELAYVPAYEVETDTLAEGKGILIRQQKATYSLVERWVEGAEPVTVPEGEGWIRRGTHNVDGTGSNSAALLLRDGTLVSISSFGISLDELVKVTASLNPAPGSHEPLPNPTPPTLDEIRRQVSFPVFIPTYLPEGLTPGSIIGGELPMENVEIRYFAPDGTVGLIVVNGNPDCCPGSLQFQSEEINLPNGIAAHLVRTQTTMYGGMTLWWVQEGTHIEISGPELSEEELITIAASMSRTGDLGEIVERSKITKPTQTSELLFDPLLPAWLPEEMSKDIRVDGEIITIGFDPRPDDAPHSVLTLVEMPTALVMPGGAPDPQETREQIGEYDVSIIWRGQDCITLEWNVDDLYLQLTNPYDPPGEPRYSCDQLRRIVGSIR
jgi:outer membrane lipoprotein-sorting protein